MEPKANKKEFDKSDIPLTTKKTTDSDSNSYDISDFGDSSERHTWSSKREFVLSMVGYCVGLGNIWRFPYVCMKNGGGAFLIPFFLSLILCGMPVFLLETALGQFLGKSSWHIWSICPLLKGLGISMNLLSIFCTFYYSMILGWSIIYMVNSFKSPLPWTLCGQSWNTENCRVPQGSGVAVGNGSWIGTGASSDSGLTSLLLESINSSVTNYTIPGNGSIHDFPDVTPAFNQTGISNGTVSSTEEFWLHNVLELSSGLDDMGGLPWHTATALLASNLLVLTGIVNGIRTSGKVVYVTATMPYLLLSVILILGCTLPGSGDGVLYYIKPDFT